MAPRLRLGATDEHEESNHTDIYMAQKYKHHSDKRVELLSLLTARERQIMNLVSEGLSNKAIARQLKLTDRTIKVHLHNVFEKLGISNRTSLAALAIRQEERT
jgi:two-component system nitrate/nitrite response regulator NarL